MQFTCMVWLSVESGIIRWKGRCIYVLDLSGKLNEIKFGGSEYHEEVQNEGRMK